MPTDYAIKNGRTVFDATTFTGNGYPTSGTQTITNASGFKPDLIWIKSRSAAGAHSLTDSVRGINSQLFSNLTNAQESNTDQITSINTNGFSLGSNTTGTGSTNVNGVTHVAWQWQAGQGTTSSNTDGSITSTVSVNQTAGFSIVTYTGPGPSNNTVGHGLGAIPKLIITKNRSRSVYWIVYTATTGKDAFLRLNTTDASTSSTSIWGTSAPTSTVFGGVGTDASNGYVAGDTLVSYCWAEVAGFSKFGSYTGNGSADGPFIYTGFRPKFVLFKPSSTTGGWMIADTSRSTYNVSAAALFPNSSNAEYTIASDVGIDFLSNGIKIRGQGGELNYVNGATYIYAAFAENPFKYANAR